MPNPPACENCIALRARLAKLELALAALEPYARRLVLEATKNDRYEARWFLALQQARLILRALDE